VKVNWEHGFIIQPRNWQPGQGKYRYVYDERLPRGEWQDGNGCFLEACLVPPEQMERYKSLSGFNLAFTTTGEGVWVTPLGREICKSRLKESRVNKQAAPPMEAPEIKLPRKIIAILDSPYHDCAVFYDGDEAILFISDSKGHVSSWDLFTGRSIEKDLDLLKGYVVKVQSWKEVQDACK
jgi:hypothetical protein